jgi:hypothetical protein
VINSIHDGRRFVKGVFVPVTGGERGRQGDKETGRQEDRETGKEGDGETRKGTLNFSG